MGHWTATSRWFVTWRLWCGWYRARTGLFAWYPHSNGPLHLVSKRMASGFPLYDSYDQEFHFLCQVRQTDSLNLYAADHVRLSSYVYHLAVCFWKNPSHTACCSVMPSDAWSSWILTYSSKSEVFNTSLISDSAFMLNGWECTSILDPLLPAFVCHNALHLVVLK